LIVIVAMPVSISMIICAVSGGPYYPKLGQKATVQKTNIRCPCPQFQMFLHRTQLEASKVMWNTGRVAVYHVNHQAFIVCR